jgi:hypothetical protein
MTFGKKEKTLKLEIELVPKTAWNKSLSELLPRKAWNGIRENIIRDNGKKCQICGETNVVMNLHEVWKYDDDKHIQKLEGFILLCGLCHHVKHIGLAGILARQGKLDYDKVVEHFCRVNECTKREFEKHKTEAFEIWERRSKHQWKQDFGKYKEFIKQ